MIIRGGGGLGGEWNKVLWKKTLIQTNLMRVNYVITNSAEQRTTQVQTAEIFCLVFAASMFIYLFIFFF